MLKIVNRTVAGALLNRGYSEGEIADIVDHIDRQDTIEGAPHLRDADLPIFDCAFRPANGSRYIHYMGHIRMMAAVQPFLSGGISKTVNMPKDASADDIAHVYFEGWRSGLKCVAIYRDGSKRSQPLNTARDKKAGDEVAVAEAPVEERLPLRRRLPDVRHSITHKFSITGHDGYLTVGLYEDGEPGEVFLKMAKEGSTISGLMDTIGLMTSFALQYGVPLKFLVDKFSHTRFEPSGFTQNQDIPFAKSIVDYVFRWLGQAFLTGQKPAEAAQDTEAETIGLRAPGGDRVARIRGGSQNDPAELGYVGQEDAQPCANCGSIMVRAGACYLCRTCGESGGCG
jgi:ribonucleoside-diphosphate reductase alpha chain